MQAKPNTVADSRARLNPLRTRQSELFDKLDQSLTLLEFEPRAFDHGKCKTQIVGNLAYRPEEAQFIVKLGNGEQIIHALASVPLNLITSAARAELMEYQRRTRDLSGKRWRNRAITKETSNANQAR